eukprot:scaffold347796_cov52-Prasinocladus_malaysianus.AAC.1
MPTRDAYMMQKRYLSEWMATQFARDKAKGRSKGIFSFKLKHVPLAVSNGQPPDCTFLLASVRLHVGVSFQWVDTQSCVGVLSLVHQQYATREAARAHMWSTQIFDTKFNSADVNQSIHFGHTH